MKAASCSNGGFSYSLTAETGYGEFYSVPRVLKAIAATSSLIFTLVMPQRLERGYLITSVR